MSYIWDDGCAPEPVAVGAFGWGLVALRGVSVVAVMLAGLALMLLLRLLERPLSGLRRPVTPWITVLVCRLSLWLLGIRLDVEGAQMRRKGAVVANHASWLDILVLNARGRVCFVAKEEVAGWPGISWLARATRTVFIKRDRRAAAEQVALFRTRLLAGHKLLFFPEGTSTDSRRVLPFRPTLFAAFFDEALRDDIHIQPVSVAYLAPAGQDPRFYGWWGEMSLGESLVKVLAARPQGRVRMVYHAPVAVRDFAGRKQLAAHCEARVREGLEAALKR